MLRFSISRFIVPVFLVLCFTVSYIFMTSEILTGRRFVKVLAYYCDMRYWPTWYSIILWIIALAISTVVVLRRTPLRQRLYYLMQTAAPKPFRDIPIKRYELLVILFYLFIIATVLICLFWDAKPFIRFLRFKLYAEYFQVPIVEYFENGRVTPRLLTGPLLITLAIIFCYYYRNKRTKLILVLSLLYPFSYSSLTASSADDFYQSFAESSEIQLIEPATYQANADLNKISSVPSEKNPDGGYNADVSILQCFAVMRYFYTGGRYVNEEIRFRMRFPPKIEYGKKYPLIIWLHGYGESTGDNERHLAHLHHAIASFAGKNALDFYMIAVQCPPDNTSWQASISSENKGDSRLTVVTEIMNQAIKQYPIDEKRLGVIGISSGASATWDFVEMNPGRIAGILAFSGTPSSQLTPASFQSTSIWAFNNKGDVGASWTKTREMIEKINNSGGNGYVTLKNHGIHDSWSYPLQNKNVIQWIITQSLEGDGLLQDVLYPQRSFLTIFLLFLLPVIITMFMITFGLGKLRDKFDK